MAWFYMSQMAHFLMHFGQSKNTMMKSIFQLTFSLLLVMVFSCKSPYKTVAFKSMEELDYGKPTSFLVLDDGVKIAYQESGQGEETILFIHGLASYLPAWKKNISTLEKKYKCLAIDLPGFGKSSKGNYEINMEFYAQTIASFCAQKGIDKVILAGHSMGGQIAIVSALKYPKLVDKLILFAPAGFETFNKGEKQWFKDVMTTDGVRLTTAEQIVSNYAYNFYHFPKDAQFMVDDRLAIRSSSDFNDYCYHITQAVKAMVDGPVFDLLPFVQQPTLCIFGSKDNLIPNRYLHGGSAMEIGKKGAARIPNCQLEFIPDGGHFVMFEQAESCNLLIEKYLTGKTNR